MSKKTKQISKRERHLELKKQAMPEVKELVEKHGLNVITGCINNLRESKKIQKQIDDIENQAKELRKKIL